MKICNISYIGIQNSDIVAVFMIYKKKEIQKTHKGNAIYTHAFMHTHTYTYIYTLYIHTYIYTSTYTCIWYIKVRNRLEEPALSFIGDIIFTLIHSQVDP